MFDPGGILTLGEAVVLVVRLQGIYLTGSSNFESSVPFYAVYADYALSVGIIKNHGDYTKPVTRAAFAELIHNALPPEALPEINIIPDFGINDVAADSESGQAIYTLYRAGILTGSDRFGTFFPGGVLTRAEAAAIMVRLANPSLRVNMILPTSIPAEIIFERAADAVFMLETHDRRGVTVRTGSGFFICSSGLAITNLHVLDDAYGATATLNDGSRHPVSGVLAMCIESNLAMIKIESPDNDRNVLTLADSDFVEAGNTVFALGSPRALINSITGGIISNTARIADGRVFLQFTAPISFGSGGSALLNTLGQVVGVTSSSFSYGQNLNLAVPINHARNLEAGELIPLDELHDQE